MRDETESGTVDALVTTSVFTEMIVSFGREHPITISRPNAGSLASGEETAGLDPSTALSALDDTTRANIIGTIVGHPKGAPSKKELEYYNPSVAASTLTDNLSRQEDVGLIEVVERDREGLERGQPYRFFRLTATARDLFDRNNLYDPDAYRAMFTEVEKTDEIEAAETADRPEGSPRQQSRDLRVAGRRSQTLRDSGSVSGQR